MSRAAWTWMVYVATNNVANNVSAFGDASINQMRQLGPNAQIRVLVQQTTPQGTQRLDLGAGTSTNLGTGIDSGDPATLLDFITASANAAPAERYALVLWSHGSGWQPTEMARLAQQQASGIPVTEGELKQRDDDERRQVFFSSSVQRLLSAPTPAERAIARDDGSGHSIDCVELGQVIAQAAKALGQPIDLLGMNACQMASAEVMFQVRGNALVYVASEEDMPAFGWPYATILPQLAAQATVDGPALGRMVVEHYLNAFRAETGLPWGQGKFPAGATLAAVDVSKMADLASAVAALTKALRAALDTNIDAIWAAHGATHAFKFQLYDLASFCHALIAQPNVSQELNQAAKQVLEVLGETTLVLSEGHTAAVYDGIGGMTTYLLPPTPGITLSQYYAETAFAQATGWGDFLAEYHKAAS